MSDAPGSLEAIWRRYDADEARLSAPLSQRMLDLARLQPGMRVLDLGSGRGEPAIPAARRVAPAGEAWGVDPDARMLAMARARADGEGVDNLHLRAVPAETLAGVPERAFDAVLARWVLMYLDDPVEALRAARRALGPGGVLAAAVWGAPERVDYYTLPRAALSGLMALPPIDFDVPGTFRFADPARLRGALESAGFAQIHEERFEVSVMEAASEAELVAWARAFGMSRLLAGASDALNQAWESAFLRAASPLWRDGRIRLGGESRVVVAQAA